MEPVSYTHLDVYKRQNESRALYVLESAGLIKLDTKDGELATISNIKDNPKNLTISELDASQTASSLPSVDAAIINNTFVREAGIDYKKALFVEKANSNSKQWYNLIAAKDVYKRQQWGVVKCRP